MRKYAAFIIVLLFLISFTGCGSEEEQIKEVLILLKGDCVACDQEQVSVEGTKVTIKEEGTYVLRGSLENGMICVEAKDSDKVQLIFDGVSVTSETSAPLYILEADKVLVTLAEGSENSLKNGGTFEAVDDNHIDGAIFSKQDLTFNGAGNLSVESSAAHGIVCKDDLVFTGGTYTITSAFHGIDVNDSFRMKEAAITLAAGKDGVHAENEDDAELGFVYVESGTLEITCEGDGISAGSYLQVTDGAVTVLAGGGSENGTKAQSDSWGDFGGGMGKPGGHGGPGAMEQSEEEQEEDSTSMKGLKAETDIWIQGGTFEIDSADDGIHANGSVTVTGGNIEIMSGDDGIHAEEKLAVLNGEIKVTESYEGLEALHIEISDGSIHLVSTDDGLNAAGGTDASGMGGRDQMGGPGGKGMSGNSEGTILISGGSLYINASGDGIDSNGSLEITGGYTVVCGPTQGDTSVLDYDTTAVISGGTFIGTGSAAMAQVFSDSTQGVFAVQCSCQAGSEIVLTDAEDKVVISYTPDLDFTLICLSSPDIVSGEEYTISVDGISGTFEAY